MQKLVKDMENISELGVDINSSWNFKNGDVVLVKYEENMESSSQFDAVGKIIGLIEEYSSSTIHVKK